MTRMGRTLLFGMDGERRRPRHFIEGNQAVVIRVIRVRKTEDKAANLQFVALTESAKADRLAVEPKCRSTGQIDDPQSIRCVQEVAMSRCNVVAAQMDFAIRSGADEGEDAIDRPARAIGLTREKFNFNRRQSDGHIRTGNQRMERCSEWRRMRRDRLTQPERERTQADRFLRIHPTIRVSAMVPAQPCGCAKVADKDLTTHDLQERCLWQQIRRMESDITAAVAADEGKRLRQRSHRCHRAIEIFNRQIEGRERPATRGKPGQQR